MAAKTGSCNIACTQRHGSNDYNIVTEDIMVPDYFAPSLNLMYVDIACTHTNTCKQTEPITVHCGAANETVSVLKLRPKCVKSCYCVTHSLFC